MQIKITNQELITLLKEYQKNITKSRNDLVSKSLKIERVPMSKVAEKLLLKQLTK